MVHHLIAVEPDYEVAMAQAVGGNYYEAGALERGILESLGLQGANYVIDIGAGSGRLATALSDLPNLRYLGTDVVPELLDFARKKCGRADWTFKQIETLQIPEADGVADFVVFFSVLTHLTEAEGYRYLQEAKRVVKKSGTIVVSYLDPEIESQARQSSFRIETLRVHLMQVWQTWRDYKWWSQRLKRMLGRGKTLTSLLNKQVLNRWAKELNLSITFLDEARVGQSICTFRFDSARP
jgi:ubiquinone/menaquinone biosynthesis C-methylase UbiE